MMTKNQVKKIALEYLKGNRLMTLAASSANQPWAAAVFFAYGGHFNLYFFSRPETKHCKNIKKNPKVAVAINQDWGQSGSIKGFQMEGKAAKVPKNKYASSFAIYRKRFKWASEFKDRHLYQIKPKEVYHINQKVFGHFFRVRIV